jgi:hypothetical protein
MCDMADDNFSHGEAESAQTGFPHGLQDFCTGAAQRLSSVEPLHHENPKRVRAIIGERWTNFEAKALIEPQGLSRLDASF